jgi:hypothetical protein
MKGRFEYVAGVVPEGRCGGSHVRPPRPSEEQQPLPYTQEEVAELLSLIPHKADKAEVPKMEKLSDVNYIGHVAEASALPDSLDQPAWALVGSVKESTPYFYYVAPFIPKGYKAGWNNMSDALGTYDLTIDKVSIFDYTLLTEYNVSNNHLHESFVYSLDWRKIPYSSSYPLYDKDKLYDCHQRVRMPDDEDNSYQSVRRTAEAPYTIESTSLFTLTEAIDSTPDEYRTPGMRLTFCSSESHRVETWIFLNIHKNFWNDLTQWQKVDYRAQQNELIAKEAYRENFDLPELTAARAIADDFGRRFTDEYIRKDTIVNYLTEVLNKLFVENPPTILDGYITPTMLSESTKELLGSDSVTNLPDEEDITTVDGVLKFKDRPYFPTGDRGKGYKLLRCNMVNGVNVLIQDAINTPNTLYESRYDFDLGGKTITLPEGSILCVKGGSFRNGTIDLNGCLADIPGQFWEECFKNSVTVTGIAKGQLIVHADSMEFMKSEGPITIV